MTTFTWFHNIDSLPPAVVEHELKVCQRLLCGGVAVSLDLFVDGFHVHGVSDDGVIVWVVLLAGLFHEQSDWLDAVLGAKPATTQKFYSRHNP